MTRLIVVPASEVGAHEPCWWHLTYEQAAHHLTESERTGRPIDLAIVKPSSLASFAIVERPSAPTTDPRAESFWSAAFVALLGPASHLVGVSEAARLADFALEEWRKRFAPEGK